VLQNAIAKEWNGALHPICQTFATRWSHSIRSSPELHLLFAKFCGGFSFIQNLIAKSCTDA